MKNNKLLVFFCLLLIAGIANAQQQVNVNEIRNAAINTLYRKADVLNRSADTEIDTINNDSLKTVSNFKRHSIYAELLGSSFFYSINYDYLLRIYKDNIKLAVGAGIGYIFLLIGAGHEKGLLRAFYFTPEVNFLFGEKSHYFETGTAFMTGMNKYIQIVPGGRIGYRYQPQKGGFLFRIAYTPAFTTWGWLGYSWFGASFGYIF